MKETQQSTNMSDYQSAMNFETERPLKTALTRGLFGKCPACAEGAIFARYLKVDTACSSCGEPLHHHRSDDAPPYFVILIVGHIIIAGILTLEQAFSPPEWVHMMIWIPLTIVLSLALLPPIKGMIIALQWALRMHGFANPNRSADRVDDR